jgi:hypothetical protein
MSDPDERNQIFRDRLVALSDELNGGLNQDRVLRRTVGVYALRMPQEAGARDWTDLKARADGATYDSMLKMFQKHSEDAHARGETSVVKAFEVLALSMIARRQYQADLDAGIAFLDKFIDNCATRARRANAQFIPSARVRR